MLISSRGDVEAYAPGGKPPHALATEEANEGGKLREGRPRKAVGTRRRRFGRETARREEVSGDDRA